MGWGLVGLDGRFSDFYRKISEILGCFVEKLDWFWVLEFRILEWVRLVNWAGFRIGGSGSLKNFW